MSSQQTMSDRKDPAAIRSMFDSIAPTYDLLNHLLSFGMDIRWRKTAARLLEAKRGGSFLDIAAGSGDFSITLLSLKPELVVSTDFAFRMLEVFRKKINGRDGTGVIALASCDALGLPFRDASFDGTVVAFGIRNFADRSRSLGEMLRVLKPGGITIILELTHPAGPVASFFYTIYTRLLLPLIGAVISRHNRAYRYLPESISLFPRNAEFCHMMSDAGFVEVEALPLTFGVATIFKGVKGQ